MAGFAGQGKVAVIRTRPETVLEDIARVMDLGGFQAALDPGLTTGLKINMSWQSWYPASSTTPWQLEGAVRTLQAAGFWKLVGVHNDTAGVDTRVGEVHNKHRIVTDRLGVPCIYLDQDRFELTAYTPRRPFLALDRLFPDGVTLPKALVGMNMVHLPTVKTHSMLSIAGAMENALGGLLHRKRLLAYGMLPETLVDLLMIQQDIHPGIFALMDGTFAGDGAGPRSLHWHDKGLLLASADQVALDAVSARLQGFDPLKVKYLRLAHEMELGVADPRQIEVLGIDIAQEAPWKFSVEDNLPALGQRSFFSGPLRPLKKALLHGPIALLVPFASRFYYNVYWYPAVGRKRVELALQNRWGRLFRDYGDGKVVIPGVDRKTAVQAAVGVGLASTLVGALVFLLLRRKRKTRR